MAKIATCLLLPLQSCCNFIFDSISEYQSLIYTCFAFTICVIGPSMVLLLSSNLSGSAVFAVFVFFVSAIFTTTAFVAVFRSLSASKSTLSVVAVGTLLII